MATLPASGAISINDFNVGMGGALGFSSGRNTGLNDASVRAVADKVSGAISLADLRGKHVVRQRNPLALVSAIPSAVVAVIGSGHTGIFLEFLDTGYLKIVAVNGVGTEVFTFQTNWLLPATADTFECMKQLNVTVTRTAWNGLGSVNTNLATEAWGSRGNFRLSADKSGANYPDVTYSVTFADRFALSNTLTFSLRMYFA